MVYGEESLSIKSYNPNVCKHKGSYVFRQYGKYSNTDTHDRIWKLLPEKETHGRLPHISNLRNILSETIANITKDNNLMKGESVELTLEIELMKTGDNTPTNSLVEITIIQHNKIEPIIQHNMTEPKIQHNKTEHQSSNNTCTNPSLTKIIPIHQVTNSYISESASQKRRNWFERVIRRESNENTKKTLINKNAEDENKHYWKTNEKPISFSTQVNKNENKSINNNRNNFVVVLPNETTARGNFTQGYRNISPNRITPKVNNQYKKIRNIMTATRKDSLVKKISDIFLPTKKPEKCKAVKKALTALKNEVDNMKLAAEGDNDNNKRRPPVHNLGKLVSNILVDVMENSDVAITSDMKDSSLPVQYHSFFEPITKPRKVDRWKKKKFINKKKVTGSHSDTCCVKPIKNISGTKLKISTSVSDCRASTAIKTQAGICFDESPEISTKKRKRFNNQTKNQRKQEGEHKKHNLQRKYEQNAKCKKLTHSKTSEIEWNGKTVLINKEIKTRIEMLIVNELQNLAVKEGMECDVTPLPSTDVSIKDINTNEKVSSFICELDISDIKLKKITKHKTSGSKVNADKLLQKKLSQHHKKRKEKTKTKEIKMLNTTGISKQTNTTQETINSEGLKEKILKKEIVKNCKTFNKKSRLSLPNKRDRNINYVEVTYLNNNVKNWSAESNTVQFDSPLIKEPQYTQITSKESTSFEFCDKENCNKYVSSGFVKRIESNDSNWNKYLSKEDIEEVEKTNKKHSKQQIKVTDTQTVMKYKSATSNEYESNIEIELDIADLEMLIKEAKEKQQSEKVLITAKCKNRAKKSIKFTGKNSPSYTNQVLASAAKKLEKYVKSKREDTKINVTKPIKRN